MFATLKIFNRMLKAKGITKSYGSLKVLKGIDLEVREGEIVSIVGASGAGKSTLLHILGALDRPDVGTVIFNDENIFKYNDEKLAKFRNQHVGFIFQFHHLLPEFTAIENVIIPQMINGTSFDEAKVIGEELLNAVGLTERINHKPAVLSGGEHQRVAVARSLANDPEIIFADEPTGNLDSKNSEEIHKLIIELKEKFNKTFVIVTHNSSLVNLADKIFEIKDGKIYSV